MAPDNADRVVEVLKEFGFDVPDLSADLFLKRDQIVRLGEEPVRIELTTTISGVEFEECYPKRVDTTVDNVPISIISLQHLRVNQRATARAKDIADLENLPESSS